jgi:hypothetical protein
MASEYSKPMLDVGAPRVLNVNVLTRRMLAKDPTATPFFRSKQLNNAVLIKDTVPPSNTRQSTSGIGTKLYFPFNENSVYEGGRTIFVHDPQLERALFEFFGQDGLAKDALAYDLRTLFVLDKLPSLDPFLLKDMLLNEKVEVNSAYFDLDQEFFKRIEMFILQRFEPLIKAAFPGAMESDEMARKLIEKIWEARDLEALQPIISAFRLPKGQELEIMVAWKGINFYAFQAQNTKPLVAKMMEWLKSVQIPVAAVSAAERAEVKASLESVRTQLQSEWGQGETILRDYQEGYDKMFKHMVSSTEFLSFLRKSIKSYWDLGGSLGKVGHAVYCWDMTTKRFPERKLPWEQLREMIITLSKIFKVYKKAATAVKW